LWLQTIEKTKLQLADTEPFNLQSVEICAARQATISSAVRQFDEFNVSFVSVTQQFNTTSSMGRLTFNVLLSFEQFEREVLPSGTPAVFFISAANYPLVRNDEISIRPSATYTISKAASLQGFYWFQRLTPSDWRYQGLQYGAKTNYLPTSETAPSYAVHVAGLSLTWAF
jgi:hypothetical protein